MAIVIMAIVSMAIVIMASVIMVNVSEQEGGGNFKFVKIYFKLAWEPLHRFA